MRRVLLAALAAVALTACADAAPTAPPAAEGTAAAPAREDGYTVTALGDQWSLYSSQSPADILSSTESWEVGSRFSSTVAGCIIALRFYRAPGETGSNVVKVWSNSGGSPLVSRTVAGSTASSGWHEVYLYHPLVDQRVPISANTYYRVTANTNTKQAKSYAYLDNGPIGNGPLSSSLSYYIQGAGNFPTTSSTSIFFVDLIFQEGPCS